MSGYQSPGYQNNGRYNTGPGCACCGDACYGICGCSHCTKQRLSQKAEAVGEKIVNKIEATCRFCGNLIEEDDISKSDSPHEICFTIESGWRDFNCGLYHQAAADFEEVAALLRAKAR